MSGQQLEQVMAMLQVMQKEQQARDELMSERMSKLEAQVISKDDLSEMGQRRGEMSAKIDTVSSDVRVMN